MAVISITGCPGVGKSFLAKQLSSYLSLPVLLEGEEGTIPSWVFEDVLSGGSPVKRWKFFLDRYALALTRARTISQAGVSCIIDMDERIVPALITYENELYREELDALVKEEFHPPPVDVTILLLSSKEQIQEFIKKRGRSSENNSEMLTRSMHIQEQLLSLLEGEDSVICLQREEYNFTQEKDVQRVVDAIKKWL
ncbi:MAG: hypothetical protein ACMXYD_01070 [Candidatus Woesearchaeota archaeon]